MTQKEIIISGVGGQGMILSGTLIAKAAAIGDRKKATLSSEYGVETRGTFAKSDIIISDDEIYYPKATNPDLTICLHRIALENYEKNFKNKGIVIYDSGLIDKNSNNKNEIGVNLSKIAKEAGSILTLNIVTIGIIVSFTDIVKKESIINEIKKFFENKNENIINTNIRAFDLGYNVGCEIKEKL